MIPRLLTKSELASTSIKDTLSHYKITQRGTVWYYFVCDNYSGSDFYEKHVNWYRVHFSKLSQVLK